MAEAVYAACRLCPRDCGVDRRAGQRGFCGETAALRLAAASIHRGEEPPITGRGGSGTVFITGCSLGCCFCQNHQISREGMGRTVSPEEFTGICLALQARGAENINLVTGSHAVPALVEGIALARSRGLSLPVLWNSSAYERPGTLELLRDTIDSYLPDLKTLDRDLAARLFNAPDYPETAVAAIIKMIENLEGRAALCAAPRRAPGSFLIIRHLALPGRLEASREVLRWFAGHAQGRLRGRAALSVMTQYTPPGVAEGGPCQAPNRFLREDEYLRLLGWLEDFGIDQGYCQELASGPAGGTAWLPDFSRVNPFSSALSTPIWHWKTGFGEDTSATLR